MTRTRHGSVVGQPEHLATGDPLRDHDPVQSPHETCWSVVARASGGDTRARSRFCRTYQPLMRAFLTARWRGTPFLREVDDAVQEVFVECLRDDGPLSKADIDRGDFRGYLFGVVRNIALRFERKAQRRRESADTQSALAAVAGREEQCSVLFDREWARTLMREAADLMRERAASGDSGATRRVELLRLRFSEDRPIRDIATEWDMETDAVHRAYAKARQEFRVCLREVVSFHAVRKEVDLDTECRRLIGLLD